MKLALFYTDNQNPNVTSYVLEQMKRSTEGVRVITIVNQAIENNPFEEIIVHNPVRNHYNIIEKILAGLKHAGSGYKTVSFLEHDVLYPEGYFNYPDFKDAACNMNYIGINQNGFQAKLKGWQLPLHQMLMKYDFAVDHFTKKLQEAVEKGSVFVEPDKVEAWISDNPAVHINHGKNFTSHFQCYSATELWQNDPYWGEHKPIWECIMK